MLYYGWVSTNYGQKCLLYAILQVKVSTSCYTDWMKVFMLCNTTVQVSASCYAGYERVSTSYYTTGVYILWAPMSACHSIGKATSCYTDCGCVYFMLYNGLGNCWMQLMTGYSISLYGIICLFHSDHFKELISQYISCHNGLILLLYSNHFKELISQYITGHNSIPNSIIGLLHSDHS